MAISLTSDPIISAADANTLLGWGTTDEETYSAINAVSARFLQFTGRSRITSGAIAAEIHNLPPYGCPVIWLKAAPVDTGETFTVEMYDDGSLSETIASGDYTLYATTGKLVLPSHGVIRQDYTRDIRVAYTGGWSSVPWDVVEAAVELMRLDKARRDGAIGVQSISREGMSTNYQTAGIPQEVKDAWAPYRIF